MQAPYKVVPGKVAKILVGVMVAACVAVAGFAGWLIPQYIQSGSIEKWKCRSSDIPFYPGDDCAFEGFDPVYGNNPWYYSVIIGAVVLFVALMATIELAERSGLLLDPSSER